MEKKKAKRFVRKASSGPAKDGTQRGTTVEGRTSILTRYSEEGSKVVELHERGFSLQDIAEELKMSPGKAERLLEWNTIPPSERIPAGTPEEELAAAVARMRDERGLSWSPQIWARTGGLGHPRLRALYEMATGRSWYESGATAPKPPRTPKASKKQKEDAPATEEATGGARPNSRGGKERELLHQIWNNDTDVDLFRNLIDGKTISVQYDVNGVRTMPQDMVVRKIRKIGQGKLGRVTEFIDEEGRFHAIWIGSIVGIK